MTIVFPVSRSEYGTIWRPVTGVTAYLATQAIKILLIASLVSLSPFWEHAIDCIGMYYFLVSQQKAIVTSVKILSKFERDTFQANKPFSQV